MVITCGKCSSYSRSLSRCIQGKVNPRTKRGTMEVIAFLGIYSICTHNKWRKGINEGEKR